MPSDRYMFLLQVLSLWTAATSLALRFWLSSYLHDRHVETWIAVGEPQLSTNLSTRESSLWKRVSWLFYVYVMAVQKSSNTHGSLFARTIVALDLLAYGLALVARILYDSE